MRLGLFNLATIASAALGLATIALWMEGYSYYRMDVYRIGGRQVTVRSIRGTIGIDVGIDPSGSGTGTAFARLSHHRAKATMFPAPMQPTRAEHRFIGFGYGVPPAVAASQRKYLAEIKAFNGGSPLPDPHFPTAPTDLRIVFPLWSVLPIFGLLPSLLLLKLRRRRSRRHRGLCLACGYDLRATPDRCPECGTEVARAFSAFSP